MSFIYNSLTFVCKHICVVYRERLGQGPLQPTVGNPASAGGLD